MTQKAQGKELPFWVVQMKDSDGHFVGGDGFMWGYKSEKEAKAQVKGLYKSGYRGVVGVIPKPKLEKKEKWTYC